MQLVINLKTAKALHLAVPQSLRSALTRSSNDQQTMVRALRLLVAKRTAGIGAALPMTHASPIGRNLPPLQPSALVRSNGKVGCRVCGNTARLRSWPIPHWANLL